MLQKILPSAAFISVPPLEGADTSDIITAWLVNQKRTLQTNQRNLLEVRYIFESENNRLLLSEKY